MLFSVEKCKVLHFGRSNVRASYQLGNIHLPTDKSERDLGVIIQDNLKVSEQCARAVRSANVVLGMINRSFSYKSQHLILTLYKALVRPRLEYCVQAWRPHLQKDIEMIEECSEELLEWSVNLKEFIMRKDYQD